MFADPANTSFKVSGTFVSPTEERHPARRKPLLERMLSLTIIGYTSYFLIVAATLTSLMSFVMHQHLVAKATRVYMYTGVALRLVDLLMAASIPIRYMIFPPSQPEREELLEKDMYGVYRSRKKEWTRRVGGFDMKLPLQIAIIVLFDWL
jgi:hypothetical protein